MSGLTQRRILNSVHKQIKNIKILSVHTQKNEKTSTEPECSSKTDIPIQIIKKKKHSGEFKPAPNILCPLTYDLFAVCVTLKNIGLLGNKAIHPYKKNKKH